MKETTSSKDVNAALMGLKTKINEIIDDSYFRFYKRIRSRLGIIFLDDKVKVPADKQQERVPDAPHFIQPVETKEIAASSVF